MDTGKVDKNYYMEEKEKAEYLDDMIVKEDMEYVAYV